MFEFFLNKAIYSLRLFVKIAKRPEGLHPGLFKRPRAPFLPSQFFGERLGYQFAECDTLLGGFGLRTAEDCVRYFERSFHLPNIVPYLWEYPHPCERIESAKATPRAEMYRMEQVLDARLKHLPA